MADPEATDEERPPLVDLDPDHGFPAPDSAETHISVLLFAGGRAYKLLKPVDFPFVHLARREQRLDALRLELEQNRRFAPDVYLGLLDLVDEGGTVHDHALVMRRLPPGRRLSGLLGRAEGAEQLRRVARLVATFHAAAPRSEVAAEAASWKSVTRNWSDNFDAMRSSVGSVIEPDEFAAVELLSDRYLAGREPLFERRIADGHAVDGHGDLLAEDIFCLEDGPRILDCLAFDERLRGGDVLADIAFLAMDIERLARPDLAMALMNWYREFSDEHHPGSLAHFYVAYRAHVRAKIATLRATQGDDRAAASAASLHRLCHRHLLRAQPRMVVLGGGPGSGKTTLAEALAEQLGCAVVGSDELRKDLAGRAHDEHEAPGLGEGIYGPELTARTYDELVRRAGLLLSFGESVILDASWSDAGHRDLARAEAGRHRADVVEICCEVDPAQAAARVGRRLRSGGDASDATPELMTELTDRMAPWPEATVIDTGGPLGHTITELLAGLAHDPAGARSSG